MLTVTTYRSNHICQIEELIAVNTGDAYKLSSKEEILDKYLYIEALQSVIQFHDLMTTQYK